MIRRSAHARSPASRRRLLRGLPLAAVALTLAACGSSTLKVVNSEPAGITLAASPNEAEAAGVQADEHCAHYGKVANLLKQQSPKGMEAVETPGATLFVFACVPAGGGQ